MRTVLRSLSLLFTLIMLFVSVRSFAQVGISITIAPPALPVAYHGRREDHQVVPVQVTRREIRRIDEHERVQLEEPGRRAWQPCWARAVRR